MNQLRVTVGGAALAVALSATACSPPPEPPVSIPVEWAPSATGPGGTNSDYSLAIDSNDSWYVESRYGSAVIGDPLRIYPRIGANGDDLGTPQLLDGGSSGILGTHTLLTNTDSFPSAGPDVQFFHETAGTWSDGGTFNLPDNTHVIEYADDTMVTATNAGNVTSISIYDVAIIGGAVTPTLESTFTAPAAWGPNYQLLFAGVNRHALEGDVLAVSSQDENGFGPGRVAIYRNIAGTWAYEDTITGNAPLFGRSLAIDDQGTKERLAIGVTKAPDLGKVDLYRSTLGNWTHESTVTAPTVPAGSDTSGGTLFGAEVSLDGNLLVVGARKHLMTPTPAGDERVLLYQSVFHRTSSTWTHEEDLLVLPAILDPAEGNRIQANTQVDGSHIISTLLVGPAPGGGPTPIYLHTQARRWDRNLLP